MKILFFTQSGARGASSRYRVCQFLPFLTAQGWTCRVAPAVSERFHNVYFHSRSFLWKALFSLWIALRRLLQLTMVPFADVVFVQKSLLPPGWPPLEPFVARLAKKLVFDFDDAIFLPPPSGIYRATPASARKMFQTRVARADLVIAGNPFLAQQATGMARRVEVLPTVVDTRRFSLRPDRQNTPLVVGWMGSPSTAFYVEDLLPVLEEVSRTAAVAWFFTGARNIKTGSLSAVREDWNYETEVARLQSFDIFISPLRDTPWEQGKCGLKALMAMSAGLPVVASDAGVHREIIRHGENGFLARGPEDWKTCLIKLLKDDALRTKMGRAARATVVQSYSLDVMAPRLGVLLRTL